MQFMIKALDGENKLARRMEVRPRHLEGIRKVSFQRGMVFRSVQYRIGKQVYGSRRNMFLPCLKIV